MMNVFTKKNVNWIQFLFVLKTHLIILNTSFFDVSLLEFDLAEIERTGGIS